MQAEDQFYIATLDYTFLDRLLTKVGTTLNSLTVGFHFLGSSSPPRDQYLEHYTTNAVASPLQCLVSLESLCIADQGHHLFDLSACLALLTSIPSSSLTRVHFKTLIDADDFTDMIPVSLSEPEEDPGRNWKAVDILLRDENRFPVLKTVNITVALEYDSQAVSLEFDNQARIKELANRDTAGSVDQTSMRIDRGLLNVEIEKVDLSLAGPESVFWKWGD
ncbi:hypothetical protein K435DRAFT_793342 [Dendrothele bispora CBS 962.96]|uniref:Uncharacterized protein n=1 Tax=Dendrothele bispora (strain CBS 962.96) TaxID=1314807 RepID=A0A4S8MFM6_DENBC|nr:hypothetical protein K435DRAFT_793342 [Dendrothele bispora CBS 962.96]